MSLVGSESSKPARAYVSAQDLLRANPEIIQDIPVRIIPESPSASFPAGLYRLKSPNELENIATGQTIRLSDITGRNQVAISVEPVPEYKNMSASRRRAEVGKLTADKVYGRAKDSYVVSSGPNKKVIGVRSGTEGHRLFSKELYDAAREGRKVAKAINTFMVEREQKKVRTMDFEAYYDETYRELHREITHTLSVGEVVETKYTMKNPLYTTNRSIRRLSANYTTYMQAGDYLKALQDVLSRETTYDPSALDSGFGRRGTARKFGINNLINWLDYYNKQILTASIEKEAMEQYSEDVKAALRRLSEFNAEEIMSGRDKGQTAQFFKDIRTVYNNRKSIGGKADYVRFLTVADELAQMEEEVTPSRVVEKMGGQANKIKNSIVRNNVRRKEFRFRRIKEEFKFVRGVTGVRITAPTFSYHTAEMDAFRSEENFLLKALDAEGDPKRKAAIMERLSAVRESMRNTIDFRGQVLNMLDGRLSFIDDALRASKDTFGIASRELFGDGNKLGAIIRDLPTRLNLGMFSGTSQEDLVRVLSNNLKHSEIHASAWDSADLGALVLEVDKLINTGEIEEIKSSEAAIDVLKKIDKSEGLMEVSHRLAKQIGKRTIVSGIVKSSLSNEEMVEMLIKGGVDEDAANAAKSILNSRLMEGSVKRQSIAEIIGEALEKKVNEYGMISKMKRTRMLSEISGHSQNPSLIARTFSHAGGLVGIGIGVFLAREMFKARENPGDNIQRGEHNSIETVARRIATTDFGSATSTIVGGTMRFVAQMAERASTVLSRKALIEAASQPISDEVVVEAMKRGLMPGFVSRRARVLSGLINGVADGEAVALAQEGRKLSRRAGEIVSKTERYLLSRDNTATALKKSEKVRRLQKEVVEREIMKKQEFRTLDLSRVGKQEVDLLGPMYTAEREIVPVATEGLNLRAVSRRGTALRESAELIDTGKKVNIHRSRYDRRKIFRADAKKILGRRTAFEVESTPRKAVIAERTGKDVELTYGKRTVKENMRLETTRSTSYKGAHYTDYDGTLQQGTLVRNPADKSIASLDSAKRKRPVATGFTERTPKWQPQHRTFFVSNPPVEEEVFHLKGRKVLTGNVSVSKVQLPDSPERYMQRRISKFREYHVKDANKMLQNYKETRYPKSGARVNQENFDLAGRFQVPSA